MGNVGTYEPMKEIKSTLDTTQYHVLILKMDMQVIQGGIFTLADNYCKL